MEIVGKRSKHLNIGQGTLNIKNVHIFLPGKQDKVLKFEGSTATEDKTGAKTRFTFTHLLHILTLLLDYSIP